MTDQNVIPTDQENFPGGFEDTDLQLVHFTREEAKTYDTLQNPSGKGEPFIDEESQLRSYAPMGELIKEEGFRQIFLTAAQEELHPQEAMPDFKHMHAMGKEIVDQVEWMPAPGDEIPEIKAIADKGEGGDKIMVLMPANMVYLLGLTKGGEVSINPLTGWAEFGGRLSNPVKEVVRIGATVVGALTGGPIGAGIGNTLAQMATGRKPGQALRQGVKAGLATWGVQSLQSLAPQMAGSSIPGLSHAGQGLQMMPQIPGFSQGMANMGLASLNPLGGASAPAAAGAAGAGAGAAGAGAGAAGAGLAGQGASSAAGGMFGQGGFMSSPLVQMGLPMSLMLGSGLMARKGDKERYGLERQEKLDAMAHQDRREEDYRRKTGYYNPLKESKLKKIVNPKRNEAGEPYYLYEGDYGYDDAMGGRLARKEGGSVKKNAYDKFIDRQQTKILHKNGVESGRLLHGPGDGQSDSIHTKVPEDTFIINAITASMLGNGDSKAGEQKVRDYLKGLEKQYSPSMLEHLDIMENGKHDIPVALSRGEIPVFPAHVWMIGGGNLKKGLSLLEDLQKKVRKDMQSGKGALPPKAKELSHYLR